VRPEVDVAALVPDPDKTIEDGAVLPWNAGGRRLYQYAARELGVRLDVPWRSLTGRERDIALHGEPVRLRTCSVCHGTRLRPEALTSLLGGRNIAEVSALRLDELREFAAGLPGPAPRCRPGNGSGSS
jgi:excinuclease ABC subunit A